jgi:uncharacterized damage-inducible protein DinB
MKVTNNTVAELQAYLQDLKKFLTKTKLDKKVFKEGTTIDQVAFHLAQSANAYLRIYILNQHFERNRSEEFFLHYTLKSINESIDKALKACNEIVENGYNLDVKLSKEKIIYSRNITITTINEVLQYATAHTAEHFGQITTTY